MVSRVTSRAANFLGLFGGNRLQVLAQLVENDGRVVRLQFAVTLVHVRTRKHVVALNRQEALSNRKERPAQVERWLVEEHCFRSVTQRGIDVSESEVERHNSRCVFKSGVEEFQRVFRITGAVQDVSKIQQRHVFRFVRCELVRHSRTRDRLDSVATHSPKQCRHVVEHPRTRKLKTTTVSNVSDWNITTVAAAPFYFLKRESDSCAKIFHTLLKLVVQTQKLLSEINLEWWQKTLWNVHL